MASKSEDKYQAFNDFTQTVTAEITAKVEEMLKQYIGELSTNIETLSSLLRTTILKQEPEKKTRKPRAGKADKADKSDDAEQANEDAGEEPEPVEPSDNGKGKAKAQTRAKPKAKAKSDKEIDNEIPRNPDDLVVPDDEYDPNKQFNIQKMFKLTMMFYPDFRDEFAKRYPKVVTVVTNKPANKNKSENDLWKSIATEMWKQVSDTEKETVRQFMAEWLSKVKKDAQPDQF